MRTDPAKPYRIAVSAWRMRHSGRPVILSISHELGGGVGSYVEELREILAGQAEMLSAHAGQLRRGHAAESRSGRRLQRGLRCRVGLRGMAGVAALSAASRGIHVQHLARPYAGRAAAAARPRSASGFLGPRLLRHLPAGDADRCRRTLLRGAGCGGLQCVSGRAAAMAATRYRAAGGRNTAPVVAQADRVIAPSRDTADRLRRYFPDANIVAAAHLGNSAPRSAAATPDAGSAAGHCRAGRHDAAQRDSSIACRRASPRERQNLPLRFVWLAMSIRQRAAGEPFAETGRYRNDQLPGPVARSRCARGLVSGAMARDFQLYAQRLSRTGSAGDRAGHRRVSRAAGRPKLDLDRALGSGHRSHG